MDLSRIICPGDTYFLERLPDMQQVYDVAERIAREYRPKTILEIGVRAGYSAYAFIKGSGQVLKYTGIDLDDQAMYGGPWLWYAEELLANLNVSWEIKKVDSQSLTEIRGLFDLIHIDGDHTYKGCLHDMLIGWPAVAPGGVMVVDDAESQPGPKGAVAVFSKMFIGAARMYLEPSPHGQMVFVKA